MSLTPPMHPVKTLETITYIQGKPVSQMNENDFFNVINSLNARLDMLKGLPKSHYVTAKVEETKEELSTIVDLMDKHLG